MYHVFADVAEWKGGLVHSVQLSDPLRAVALALTTGDDLHLLVANVTAEAQRIRIEGLGGDAAMVRVLDEASAAWALADPAAFRSWAGGGQPVRDSTLWLELGPYAVARVDARRVRLISSRRGPAAPRTGRAARAAC